MQFILASAGPESLLVHVLVQLVIIVAVVRVMAWLAGKIGQPAAVGEIIAGVLLGPTLLGACFPGLFAEIFHPAGAPQAADVFSILSQLGLIFLLFLIGLEFDFSHLKKHAHSAAGISVAGIAVPFVLGWWLAGFVHAELNPTADFTSFALFMGTAMSITALPILGRIMMELNIQRTRMGAVTITAAAIDDAMGWILLATVSGLVRVQASFSYWTTVRMLGLVVGFGLVMFFVVRPLVLRWAAKSLAANNGELSLFALAALFVLMMLCAIATSLIGIFAIFGAFTLGAMLSSDEKLREAVTKRMHDFVVAFFLPIFFTTTGLRTNIVALDSAHLWLLAGLVCLTACAGKFGGTAIAARLGGFDTRESVCIGIMMNARALMELVVINVGYELGVIPQSLFSMLVIMALVTTCMTTPVLLWLLRNHPTLRPLVAQSNLGHWMPRATAL